ncbi:MAG TPA: thioredoxin family protein [bacterium]|nr:thioredoxin family protein [bacterium]
MKKYMIVFVLFFGIIVYSCSSNSHEIEWGHNIDTSLQKAKQMELPIMIDFMADWCPPCQEMEKTTFVDSEFLKKSEKFILVRIDVDDNQEVAKKYNGNANKYGGIGIPNILFLNSNGQTIRHIVGYKNAEQLTSVMDSVLTGKYENYSAK